MRDYSGPWPLATDLVRTELAAYREAAHPRTIQRLPTRCLPWTVRDLTIHLAATFRRFGDMLEQSRAGDLSPPFASHELAVHNRHDVAHFTGDALVALQISADRFLDQVGDPAELMAHQYGPIPVGLQVLFGLNDVAIHRSDLEEATGRQYRPNSATVTALIPVWERVLGGLPAGTDPWERIVVASGRSL